MLNFTTGFDQDGFFATGNRRRKTGSFVADSGEEGRERVEIMLAVDFEGVLMTLSAVESNTEE